MPSKESLDRAARWYGYDNDAECVGKTMRVKVDQLAAEFDAAKMEEAKHWSDIWKQFGRSKDWTVWTCRRIAALERPAEGETKEKR